MSSIFIIYDEAHAETQDGEYKTFEEAKTALKKRMEIPWDKDPNLAPCTEWKTCGRRYEIIEYDTSDIPWKEISSVPALNISAKEIKWSLK